MGVSIIVYLVLVIVVVGLLSIPQKKIELPKCYGSDPSPLEQAENDCFTCGDQRECLGG